MASFFKFVKDTNIDRDDIQLYIKSQDIYSAILDFFIRWCLFQVYVVMTKKTLYDVMKECRLQIWSTFSLVDIHARRQTIHNSSLLFCCVDENSSSFNSFSIYGYVYRDDNPLLFPWNSFQFSLSSSNGILISYHNTICIIRL